MEEKPNEEEQKEKPEEEEEGEAKTEEKKTLSPNERAEANVAAMKVENERLEKNLLALQEVKATEMLSGSANAGQAPEKPAEETNEQYAAKAISGDLNEEA